MKSHSAPGAHLCVAMRRRGERAPLHEHPSRARPAVLRRPAKRWWTKLGPGLITGAADDDPSGIATYSQAGAQLGYGAGWTLLFTYPLMVGIQLASARIGRVTGQGLTETFARFCPRWLVAALVLLLLVANVINLGADLSAMGASAAMVLPGRAAWYAVGFGVVSLLLQVFLPYERYVRVLKWLTLSLFAYVGVVFAVDVDWGAAMQGVFAPSLPVEQGVRHDRRRDPRHHHQPLPLLLAGVAGSARRSSACPKTDRCASRPSRRAVSCGGCASTPRWAWASRT